MNLAIPRRRVHLIGPNGAGKTTVFNLITGLQRPDGGAIREGRDLAGSSRTRSRGWAWRAPSRTSASSRGMSLLENVMVGQHSHLNYGAIGSLAASAGFRRQEHSPRARGRAVVLGRPATEAGAVADKLSYGEQRKLELARALATEPGLLLLDGCRWPA